MGVAAGTTGFFAVLLVAFDYESGWTFATLHYEGFWTFGGFFRNLVFNGWHPVLPWIDFFVIGLWVGRLDLSDRGLQRRLLWGGAVIALVAGATSEFSIMLLAGDSGQTNSDVASALGTEPLPPPLSLIAAAGTALTVIGTIAVAVAWRKRFRPRSTRDAHVAHMRLRPVTVWTFVSGMHPCDGVERKGMPGR